MWVTTWICFLKNPSWRSGDNVTVWTSQDLRKCRDAPAAATFQHVNHLRNSTPTPCAIGTGRSWWVWPRRRLKRPGSHRRLDLRWLICCMSDLVVLILCRTRKHDQQNDHRSLFKRSLTYVSRLVQSLLGWLVCFQTDGMVIPTDWTFSTRAIEAWWQSAWLMQLGLVDDNLVESPN